MTRRNSARSVEGVTFDRCHPSTPLCCPSRSTCLSGQFARNNGVRHNKGADFTVRLPSWGPRRRLSFVVGLRRPS